MESEPYFVLTPTQKNKKKRTNITWREGTRTKGRNPLHQKKRISPINPILHIHQEAVLPNLWRGKTGNSSPESWIPTSWAGFWLFLLYTKLTNPHPPTCKKFSNADFQIKNFLKWKKLYKKMCQMTSANNIHTGNFVWNNFALLIYEGQSKIKVRYFLSFFFFGKHRNKQLKPRSHSRMKAANVR